jgi:hypothetical protein
MMLFAAPYELSAQEKERSVPGKVGHGIKEGAKGVKKGAKKGAHEVAEQTVEMKSDITDPEVDDKMGPKGEDIFRDDNNRYYYVDGKGHKVYLTASQLRNKPAERDDD